MACQVNNNINASIIELVSEQGFAGLGEAMQLLFNEAMKIERGKHLNAEPYERTEERNGYANGFKPKKIKSRVGELELIKQQLFCKFQNLPKPYN